MEFDVYRRIRRRAVWHYHHQCRFHQFWQGAAHSLFPTRSHHQTWRATGIDVRMHERASTASTTHRQDFLQEADMGLWGFGRHIHHARRSHNCKGDFSFKPSEFNQATLFMIMGCFGSLFLLCGQTDDTSSIISGATD